ncbi:hypothetical protein BDW59DRAFT_166545 [Aspergillus cavernicola]|uniref:DUF7730 domain-containing protein n=1 Tax=Aspergillus cavernicola TaxID=176166 RepID=A0ABR4HKJ6_9EURO
MPPHNPDKVYSDMDQLLAIGKRSRGGSGKEQAMYQGLLHKRFRRSFLDLPLDVRQQIYRYVFGYRILESGSGFDKKLNYFSFRTLVREYRLVGNRVMVRRERLHLNLLLANKQIYDEAKEIPYSNNAFIFTDPHLLAHFGFSPKGIAKHNLGLIREILIYIQPGTVNGHYWNSWLWRNREALAGLSTLQHLRIQVQFTQFPVGDPRNNTKPWGFCYVQGLLMFCEVGIREISVKISNHTSWRGEQMVQAARYAMALQKALMSQRVQAGRIWRQWDQEKRCEWCLRRAGHV